MQQAYQPKSQSVGMTQRRIAGPQLFGVFVWMPPGWLAGAYVPSLRDFWARAIFSLTEAVCIVMLDTPSG